MPMMEETVDELQIMVDRLSQEVEREVRKRNQALHDREVSLEKLEVYKRVYEELNIDDPARFMQDFANL